MTRPIAAALALVLHALLVSPDGAGAQPPPATIQPVTVVLVRHAEKETAPASSAGGSGGMQASGDVSLTDAGRVRARLLASMLKDAGITAIFTSSARRTKETAAPLAEARHLTPAVIAEDSARVRAQVLAAPGASPHAPPRVLIVGHSNTVPALIAALGGPADVTIGDPEFDGLFILSVPPTGPSTLVTLRYGAPASAATP
jgi:broad specificity phosphatase PhoE